MPPERTIDHHRKPREPQSCNTCRLKKPKCDRRRPCSNCTTRRITCEYRTGVLSTNLQNAIANGDVDLYAQNADFKARIQRLEQAVFGEQPDTAEPEPNQNRSSSLARISEATDDGAANDVQWLESVGSRIADVLPNTSETPHIVIELPEHFLEAADNASKLRSVVLPTHEVAIAYLESYEQFLDGLQPIMHVPSTREMTEKVYIELQDQQPVSSGSVALILAICAYVELWDVHRGGSSIRSTDKVRASTVLLNQALHAFENARALSQSSIELVQSAILLSFHLGHLDGISTQSRLLHSNAITMARGLGLHLMDKRNNPTHFGSEEVIQAEVGRRIWWHLTSTDWLFAYTGGPHEGVYSIQPRHMAAGRPRNICHEDLSTRDVDFQRPRDEATVMTFYLQRIQLAFICREVVDTLWNTSLEPYDIPYEEIKRLDSKFSTLISGLPRPLRSDDSRHFEHETISGGYVGLQRLLANVLICTRRCRLHVPFLVRHRFDSRYAFSRDVCLDSARKVLRAWNAFQHEDYLKIYTAISRLGSILGQVLYATVVFVIDFCVNRDGGFSEEQMSEVRDAIRIAEQAREVSRIAAAFWASLADVLRKHQVDMHMGQRMNDVTGGSERPTESRYPIMQSVPADVHFQDSEYLMDQSYGFEDIWQQLLDNQSLTDPQNWDSLLSDLDWRAA